jgi:hypothetical protein
MRESQYLSVHAFQQLGSPGADDSGCHQALSPRRHRMKIHGNAVGVST